MEEEVAAMDNNAKPGGKTQLELAREKLTQAEYLRMKEQGLTDRAILKQIGIPHPYVLLKLKREWGLSGHQAQSTQAGAAQQAQTGKTGKIVSLEKALKMREELKAEIDYINQHGVIDEGQRKVPPGVQEVLSRHRDECIKALGKIDRALKNQKIEI